MSALCLLKPGEYNYRMYTSRTLRSPHLHADSTDYHLYPPAISVDVTLGNIAMSDPGRTEALTEEALRPSGSEPLSPTSFSTAVSATVDTNHSLPELEEDTVQQPETLGSLSNSSTLRDARRPSLQQRKGAQEQFHRHERYFLKGGSVMFCVENTLFYVHRSDFERSRWFSERFELDSYRTTGESSSCLHCGSDPYEYYELSWVTVKEFEHFLSTIYPREFLRPDLTTCEEWTSVLRLAYFWEFDSLRRFAIERLDALVTPFERLDLARSYKVKGWVLPALVSLCKRTAPLRAVEISKMKPYDIQVVTTVRESVGRGASGEEGRDEEVDEMLETLLAQESGMILPPALEYFSWYNRSRCPFIFKKRMDSSHDNRPPSHHAQTTLSFDTDLKESSPTPLRRKNSDEGSSSGRSEYMPSFQTGSVLHGDESSVLESDSDREDDPDETMYY
ncbi:hypothetical protein OF83DRAFT_1085123 [Amylostereum chailletii]|nr:hypothetical protein OF83DRAFT_1085123 [Amylostereum chailletii]